MSAKNAGVSTHLPRAAAKRRQSRKRNAGRCLRAEQLESRQLMTAGVEFSAALVLMAGGRDRPDPRQRQVLRRKASNYGLLRRTIPDSSERGFLGQRRENQRPPMPLCLPSSRSG